MEIKKENPKVEIKGGTGCFVWIWLLFFQWVPLWAEIFVTLVIVAAVETIIHKILDSKKES